MPPGGVSGCNSKPRQSRSKSNSSSSLTRLLRSAIKQNGHTKSEYRRSLIIRVVSPHGCWRGVCTNLPREDCAMPEKETIKRARADKRQGKSPSTQAGEFVHEEIKHVRSGKHGARSSKQAIAIGLSKARRAGVKLPAPPKGRASAQTRASAKRALAKGRSNGKTSARRSRAVESALKREGRSAASHTALSRQARTAALRRSAASRHRSAVKAAHTRAAG
jgi:uncharacterized protein DUF6496